MSFRLPALFVMLAGLAACATSVPRVSTPQDPTQAHAVASMDSSRDIVLAVANPIEPPSARAGSNLLGYSPGRGYGAGQRAMATIDDLKRRYGLQETTGWPIRALDLYCVVVHPAGDVSRETLMAQLAKDQRVALVQPLQDYAVYGQDDPAAHHYNDPYADLQRGFVETDAALAHRYTQGERVHIAVIDTGVDITHPDLQGRVRDVANEVDTNDDAFQHDRHGTEVVGIIAAQGDNHLGIVGIAPKSVISVYKACWYPADAGNVARCNSFTLAKALAAVLDTDARIINLSLGGPSDPLLGRLLAQLIEQRRIVITALPPAGRAEGFPSSMPGVIVVRTSAGGSPPKGVLSAPGNDILTTQPGGGYDFSSGSSMAAAHVSGIAALLLALSPELSAQSVYDQLDRTTKAVAGTQQVDAATAVDAMEATRTVSR